MKPSISLVVPVYNAHSSLSELVRRSETALEKITDNFEIVLVDDRSTDNSWSEIKRLAKRSRRIYGIRLARNFGQHSAITAGLKNSKGEFIVLMDCDLQDEPEDIGLLMGALSGETQVVIARWGKRKTGPLRSLASNCFYAIFNSFTGEKYDPGIRTFRVFTRNVLQQILEMPQQTRSTGPLMNWLGFQTCFVETQGSVRLHGKSSYTPLKLLKTGLHNLIAFTNRPLYFAIWLGSLFAVSALVSGLAIVFKWVYGDKSLPGWPSLIASVFFLGGLVLVNLGVVGIYVGQIFKEVKKLPLFIVSDEVKS